jgi:two-component system, LytTR family, response regulator LytT
MKRTAVIIEDEVLSAERLSGLLSAHSTIQVATCLHSVKGARDWFAQNDIPEILFLDIQLGDGTGFDILEQLTAFPKVIFTTAFDQYTLEAFKYNSIDYLLKPIKPDELAGAIEKLDKLEPNHLHQQFDSLNAHLFRKYKSRFLVKTGMKFQSIPVEDICYLYSEDSTSYLKTTSGKYILDQPLDELEKLMDPTHFFRTNRSMIVRNVAIKNIETYFNGRLLLELIPGCDFEVIVSREKVKAFKEWLDA